GRGPRRCARLGHPDRAEEIYRDLADAAPAEAVYRDLFLLYLERDPQGAARVALLLDAALEAAARKDDPLGDNPAPARARGMVNAVRETPALARAVVAAAAALAPRRPLHPDTLQIMAAIADRLDLLPEAEVLYR